MSKKLFVGNIPFKAREEDLKDLFAKYGEVSSVNFIVDKGSGRAKGFGFVEMASDEGAIKAVEALNGAQFTERTLTVAEANPLRKDKRERRDGEQ